MFCVNAVNRCSAARIRSENGSTPPPPVPVPVPDVFIVFVGFIVEVYELECSRVTGVPDVDVVVPVVMV